MKIEGKALSVLSNIKLNSEDFELTVLEKDPS